MSYGGEVMLVVWLLERGGCLFDCAARREAGGSSAKAGEMWGSGTGCRGLQ